MRCPAVQCIGLDLYTFHTLPSNHQRVLCLLDRQGTYVWHLAGTGPFFLSLIKAVPQTFVGHRKHAAVCEADIHVGVTDVVIMTEEHGRACCGASKAPHQSRDSGNGIRAHGNVRFRNGYCQAFDALRRSRRPGTMSSSMVFPSLTNLFTRYGFVERIPYPLADYGVMLTICSASEPCIAFGALMKVVLDICGGV